MEIVKLECNLLVSYKKISINISDRELQKISPYFNNQSEKRLEILSNDQSFF